MVVLCTLCVCWACLCACRYAFVEHVCVCAARCLKLLRGWGVQKLSFLAILTMFSQRCTGTVLRHCRNNKGVGTAVGRDGP